jgi:uncharacterized protein (TIGR03084 family)
MTTEAGAAREVAARHDFDDLLDDLVAETASLRRLLAGLAPGGWETPTPAAGWAVRDQIGHLAYFDEAALLAVRDPERFGAEAAGLMARGDDFADAVARDVRHLPPDELLAWWDRSRAALVRAYRAADRSARVPWYGPPMSVMSAATARLMETWAHGVDVADALGATLEDSPRLRHVAHLGVRTMAFSFALHGLAAPAEPVLVELTGAGGGRWRFGPDDATNVVRGPALEFCLVVTQRRHVDDTSLEVAGPVADAWVRTAQAFAGRPTLVAAGRAGGAGGPALGRNLVHRVNVGDLLTRSARRRPDAEAVVDGDRRLSYGELDAWVNRVAHGLSRRGYRRGDRLALVSGNCAEFLVVYFACAKLGVVCVPVNLGWSPEEVTYVLGHSAARGVVAQAGRLAGLAPSISATPAVTHVVAIGPLPADPGGEPTTGGPAIETLDDLAAGVPASEPAVVVEDRDPISVLYTSGTTSAPKGVVASQLAVYVESLSMAVECRFGPADRFVAMLPMFHTAQLNVQCTPAIAVGATIHVLAAFDPGRLLDLIETEGITQIFGLPMMYRAMLEHRDAGGRGITGRDLTSLRRATYAMAPMPEGDLRRAIEIFGCDFCLMFGQTEMSPSTTIFRPEHQLSHAGAVGTPIVGVEVAIMDGDGALLPRGRQGEIVYRSPQVMTGYLDDPVATEAAFAHGWFHSGDAGAFDDDGVLWFRDRFKDVVKTGGENVATLEVERAILSHVPGVAEAAVVGLHHDRWSEAITAFIVPRPGTTVELDGLREALRGHLDGYKMPKAVVTVDALPRTSTGKVRKTQLRAEWGRLYDRSE